MGRKVGHNLVVAAKTDGGASFQSPRAGVLPSTPLAARNTTTARSWKKRTIQRHDPSHELAQIRRPPPPLTRMKRAAATTSTPRGTKRPPRSGGHRTVQTPPPRSATKKQREPSLRTEIQRKLIRRRHRHRRSRSHGQPKP